MKSAQAYGRLGTRGKKRLGLVSRRPPTFVGLPVLPNPSQDIAAAGPAPTVPELACAVILVLGGVRAGGTNRDARPSAAISVQGIRAGENASGEYQVAQMLLSGVEGHSPHNCPPN